MPDRVVDVKRGRLLASRFGLPFVRCCSCITYASANRYFAHDGLPPVNRRASYCFVAVKSRD